MLIGRLHKLLGPDNADSRGAQACHQIDAKPGELCCLSRTISTGQQMWCYGDVSKKEESLHKTKCFTGEIHDLERGRRRLSHAEIIDKGKKVSLVDIVRAKIRTVCSHERQRSFEHEYCIDSWYENGFLDQISGVVSSYEYMSYA